MKVKFFHIIKTKPVFLFLLPFFFVIHGFTENYGFIPVKDALLLILIYSAASMLLSLTGWLLYRNFTKANLVAFYLMAFNFFFGSLHDAIRNIFPDSFISKYTFILPVAFILLLVLMIWLWKRKTSLLTITYYLNVLFILLLSGEIVLLSGKSLTNRKPSTVMPKGFALCDSCPKPDIYFILADEYAGNTGLEELFQFDNSAFLKELETFNFHTIPVSSSNYNYTPFSVASILNMDYLKLNGKDRVGLNLTYTYQAIRENQLLRFLRLHHYDFYNNSVFDFEGQPARIRETFLPVKTRLITAQTFLSRFDKEIRFNFVYRWKSKKNQEIITYANKDNNDNIYDLTWKLAEKKTTSPKFVYSHLMMPHYPYYFDKDGKEQSYQSLQEGNQSNKEAYVEYLQFANKKFLALVDHILKSSKTPPIIILMGDHGFRHFSEPVEKKYYFLNLASVYLPSKDYAGFSDSLSGVNFFRTILNTSFNQRLPFLKDSTIYLKD